MNVIYDRASNHYTPRLAVIVEHENDVQKFYDGYNFDQEKQEAIAVQFLNIISSKSSHGYDVDGLFVAFSAFAPIAREEADSQISEEQINALKNRLADPDLWVISRNFGSVTFLFYTDEQVANHEACGHKELYARKYFEILKPYDEFGYLEEGDFSVNFDSKQNFDDNYESNWFYYSR